MCLVFSVLVQRSNLLCKYNVPFSVLVHEELCASCFLC